MQLDKSFPLMADTFKLKENVTFGMHIVAQKDIDVGKTLMVSYSFSSVEYLSSRCGSCFQCGRPAKRFQCQHCIEVYFCSSKCRQNRVHRKYCNRMFHREDCRTVRLVTEIIDTASKYFPDVSVFLDFCANVLIKNKKHKDCKLPYSSYNEILLLKGKSEENTFCLAKRIVTLVKSLPQFGSISVAEQNRIIFHLAYHHTTIIALNTFSEETILTKGGILTRYSIHDMLSRFNHSCAPNLHHCIDDDNKTSCITILPVKQGDQIFINYLGETEFNTDVDRKLFLKEIWGFDCKCEKCYSKHQALYDRELERSLLFIKANSNELQSKALKNKCIEFLNKYGQQWSKSVEFVTNCLKKIIHNS